jgi:magnesium-transporting ATPase (P-type)
MSGSSFYEATLNLQLYNVAYTSFPIIVYALYDQEWQPTHFCEHPYLYVAGRTGRVFTKMKFMRWIIFAAAEAAGIFFICVHLQSKTPNSYDGKMNGFWTTGLAVYTAVILNANLMVLIIAKVWSIFLFLTIFSFVFFYCMINYTMSKWYNFPVLQDNIYFGIE